MSPTWVKKLLLLGGKLNKNLIYETLKIDNNKKGRKMNELNEKIEQKCKHCRSN
jgi:hypothetical protein